MAASARVLPQPVVPGRPGELHEPDVVPRDGFAEERDRGLMVAQLLERRGDGSGRREAALPIARGCWSSSGARLRAGRRRRRRTRAGRAPPAGLPAGSAATCRSSRATASAALPIPSNAFARHVPGQHERRVQRDRGAGDRVGRGEAALLHQDLRLPDPRDQRSRLELERPCDPLVRGARSRPGGWRAVRTIPTPWRPSSRARARGGSSPRPAPARPAASRRSPTRCTTRRSSSPWRWRARAAATARRHERRGAVLHVGGEHGQRHRERRLRPGVARVPRRRPARRARSPAGARARRAG